MYGFCTWSLNMDYLVELLLCDHDFLRRVVHDEKCSNIHLLSLVVVIVVVDFNREYITSKE